MMISNFLTSSTIDDCIDDTISDAEVLHQAAIAQQQPTILVSSIFLDVVKEKKIDFQHQLNPRFSELQLSTAASPFMDALLWDAGNGVDDDELDATEGFTARTQSWWPQQQQQHHAVCDAHDMFLFLDNDGVDDDDVTDDERMQPHAAPAIVSFAAVDAMRGHIKAHQQRRAAAVQQLNHLRSQHGHQLVKLYDQFVRQQSTTAKVIGRSANVSMPTSTWKAIAKHILKSYK